MLLIAERTPAGNQRCVGNLTSGGSLVVTVNSQFHEVPDTCITSAVTLQLLKV
jgi:hypothetical protein